MSPKLAIPIIILVIVGSAGTLLAFDNLLPAPAGEIVCPKDGSPHVWTPIGTRSENFNWVCLQCGHSWTKSYPEKVYENWRNTFLEPAFVRDYALFHLRRILQLDVPDPLTLDWVGSRETPEQTLGYETYVYRADGFVVTIGYPVVLPENTIYTIKVEVEDCTLWKGTLHRRQFIECSPPLQNESKTVYDYSGGVGLFNRGIHIVATCQNPLDFAGHFETVNDYWRFLKEKTTVKASSEDFISIIISRGDHPTGGYTIQVQSFSWLESYPVQLRFSVNLTDPSEGVIVTEALTNPLVLIPIGELSPGEYVVKVYITRYILTFDEQGEPAYIPVLTFKEEVWKQAFTIE